MKGLKIRVVFSLIQESRKQLSDLRNSVGPVTSESLDKVQAFLLDLESEVAPIVPKKHTVRPQSLIVGFGFLLVLNRLLPEFVPEAIKAILQLLLK